jgi:hypothetical protein
MTSWTSDDLKTIGDADELEISSLRPDGTLRPYITIWVVRAGDDLYVRSAHGPENPWYRRAKVSGAGRIQAGGLERDVTFVDAEPDVHAELDRVYHAKYDSYGPAIVNPVVGSAAALATLRLLPRAQA